MSLEIPQFSEISKADDALFDEERPSVRWAPLGATSSPEPPEDDRAGVQSDQSEIIRKLEEEQDILTSSLTLMTNHFAQIQFRLKQLADDKSAAEIDLKLKELEDFANKGVPDVWSLKAAEESVADKSKICQKQLISDLKEKLEELESYAYQTGELEELPTSKVLANQKFIMEQLKSHLDVNFDELTNLNENELRSSVNEVINDIINPVKVREKLVDQLKTQISDLERFIEYLQDEDLHNERKSFSDKPTDTQSTFNNQHRQKSKKAHDSATIIIRKALNLLQLIAASQFGCHIKDKKKLNRNSTNPQEKSDLQHWGDTRASLEVTIEKIIELTNRKHRHSTRSMCMDSASVTGGDDATSDIDDSSSTFMEGEYDSEDDQDDKEALSQSSSSQLNRQLLGLIRKEFCVHLQALIQHGLMSGGSGGAIGTLRGVSCFAGRQRTTNSSQSTTSSAQSGKYHPWDLFVHFYEMKNGREIVNSPACKLSESFYLSNVGGKQITDKERLLKAIGIILDSHSVYKRSKDTQFKAFVSLALNEKCLCEWLKLVLKNRIILYSFYESWSYAHKMGFDDTLHSLRRLANVEFDLPYDLSVRQLSKIKDAF